MKKAIIAVIVVAVLAAGGFGYKYYKDYYADIPKDAEYYEEYVPRESDTVPEGWSSIGQANIDGQMYKIYGFIGEDSSFQTRMLATKNTFADSKVRKKTFDISSEEGIMKIPEGTDLAKYGEAFTKENFISSAEEDMALGTAKPAAIYASDEDVEYIVTSPYTEPEVDENGIVKIVVDGETQYYRYGFLKDSKQGAFWPCDKDGNIVPGELSSPVLYLECRLTGTDTYLDTEPLTEEAAVKKEKLIEEHRTARLEEEARIAAEEQAKKEEEERLAREAEEKAAREAAERAAAEKAAKEAEEKAAKEAAEKAAKEAEEKAKKEAEEKAAKEAAEKAAKEAEEKARKEAEEKAKQEGKSQEEAEKEAKEAAEKAAKEAEEKAKKEAEEKAKKEAEEKAAREAAEKAAKENPYASQYFYLEKNKDRYIAYGNANPNLSAYAVVANVNSNIDKPFYTDIQATDLSKGYLMICNKYYQLPAGYVPALELIGNGYGSGYLEPTAAAAFRKMVDAAKADGIYLWSVSPFRSYDTQYSLYHGYAARDGYANADRYSARPGHSEHQTGYGIDINNVSAAFQYTAEYAWLKANSYKYGFFERYPAGKEYLTGYMYEPWHFRYVGVDVATSIVSSGLTYEEFYAFYIDK